jgi:exodeoxyribonuclease V alpha subunit
MSAPQNIVGILERVVFYNEENGYFVGELSVEESSDSIMIQGKMISPLCGETLQLTGGWGHTKYGRQFQFTHVKQVLPSSIQGIRKFLASGIVKGVGEKLAEKIVAKFGVDVFRILNEESGRLREIKGLGEEKAIALKQAWVEHQQLRESHIYLHGLGLSSGQCERLIKRFGSAIRRMIEQNPYALIGEIDRLGFRTIDQIARNAGLPAHSPERLKAGLEFTVSQAEDDGDTAISRRELLQRASGILSSEEEAGGISQELLEHPLVELMEAELLLPVAGSNDLLQTPRMAAHEEAIATHLRRLREGGSALPSIDQERACAWAQERSKISLSSEQIEAVRGALSNKVFIITGGPGTGKTTVLRMLIDILRAKGVFYHLASPTGRAAQRMTEATGAPAQTIHRLLKYDPAERSWVHNEKTPLETEFLIVDEASMIDTPLMSALVKALPTRAHLLIVGDADQLPSVGPGEVLHDIIGCQQFRMARLKRIFRQSEGLLLRTAHNLLQGERRPPPYHRSLEQFDPALDLNAFYAATPEEAVALTVELCQRLPKLTGLHPIKDIQVLVPMHKGAAGTINLNTQLQKALNPSSPGLTLGNTRYCVGDKLLQTRNNYDKGLFNGDIGRVESIRGTTGEIEVAFTSEVATLGRSELNDTALAYAISIHKSQGSEYPCVVLPLLRAHYTMLTRNLLYTALTRGKRQVILVGDPSAYQLAASRLQTNTRTTGLRYYLGGTLPEAASPAPEADEEFR